MYAVIELKGSQIKVEKDSRITVNRIEPGKSKKIKVDKVLFAKKGNSYAIGEPYIKGAYVECEILGDRRLKKVIAFKYRDRKSSQSKKGHRQNVTDLKVVDINLGSSEKKEEKKDKK